MTKNKNTPLENYYQQLPKGLKIEPTLTQAGISFSTFSRDRKANPNTIPHWRLQVYAALFDCEVSELIESFARLKVKPLVKRNTLTKKVGIKP